MTQTTEKKRELFKAIKPLKSEDWERELFQIEVSGDMIFIWGGGMEGCVSKRVMKEFVKWMKLKKVI